MEFSAIYVCFDNLGFTEAFSLFIGKNDGFHGFIITSKYAIIDLYARNTANIRISDT
jgi:hypothetical protein